MSDPIVTAFKSLLAREGGAKAVALVIGANAQALYQIEAGVKLPSGKPKGVGKQLREQLERHYPGWLSAAGDTSSTGQTITTPESGKSQHVRPFPQRMAPPKLAWEALVSIDELPHEFETELPDNAMAPEAPKGSRCIFITTAAPEAGDWVLVRDAMGNLYCRAYKLLRPGQWEAHAVNPYFLPLDSVRDGLQVLAVFDGMRGRKAAS